MELVPVVDEGLGNTAYVVGVGDGGALVVDPARNPEPYLRIADERGWRIRFAAETHLHADFVSGARELAAATGARVLVPADAQPAFAARLLGDGDEVDVGGLRLETLATPGHTPEHSAYLLRDGGTPVGVFTGGTLIVGGMARPDLLGPQHTEPLARAAWRSLHGRLLALPDELPVYPTHGAGSFCSAGRGGRRTSTIGTERLGNPLLQAPDEDSFVARLLAGLGTYPPYFLELRPVNRAGPRVYGPEPPSLAPLVPADVERLAKDGAEVLDVRGIAAFAAGHLPGSLSNPQRAQFATWLGWLVDRARPLVFVTDEQTDRRALVWAALGIGYERFAGELAGGVDAWAGSGRPLNRIPLRVPDEVDADALVLDVRQQSEWDLGHVPGAAHLELGGLAGRAGDLGTRPLVVQCGHGERAMTAASILARAGHRDVAALAGGPGELAASRGVALERSA